MKFKKEIIFGYPYYRVEGDCPFGEEGHIVGWVEKDCLGDGWWIYREFPTPDGRGRLFSTRRDAADYLNTRVTP